MKQVQLIGTTIILVVATTAGGAYLWWQSTPQYALLEARNGFLEKNRKKFNKYVDVATLTTGFTEEIIFEPAEKTPKLTKLQRVVGLGALRAARNSIDNSLIFQIQKLVNQSKPLTTAHAAGAADDDDDTTNDAQTVTTTKVKTTTSATSSGGTADGAKKETGGVDDGEKGTGSAGDGAVAAEPKRFTSLIRMAWRREKARLKDASFRRMSEFAKAHPHTLINRIFAAPVGGRANAVKQILAECGFKGRNFKKYQLEKRGSKCIAHLTFHSPRINDLVTVTLELEKLPEGPFGRYRISRLVDFKRTLNHLKYNTDDQIQGLVAYGLQELNGQTLAGKAKEVLRGLDQSASKLEADDEDDDFDGVSDTIERYHAESLRDLSSKR